MLLNVDRLARSGKTKSTNVKGKEDPSEDKTADLATVENEEIEFIGILEEVSEREIQKSSQEELIHHLFCMQDIFASVHTWPKS